MILSRCGLDLHGDTVFGCKDPLLSINHEISLSDSTCPAVIRETQA
jgi:hypothetical protein